jgi:hypothetical protein
MKTIIATKSQCYTSNIKSGTKHKDGVKGFLIHSTGANNPDLKRYVQPDDGTIGVNKYNNSFNLGGGQVCPHFVIGKLADGSVTTVQILPLDMPCWCSGQGANGNANFLGFLQVEICEDGLTDKAYFESVKKEAVELVATQAIKFGFPIAKPSAPSWTGVTSHAEGNKLGIASNHGDPDNWWLKNFGYTIDNFRADVAAEVNRLNALDKAVNNTQAVETQNPKPPTETTTTAPQKIYRVQAGAFSVKANADAYLAKIKAAGFPDAYIVEGAR